MSTIDKNSIILSAIDRNIEEQKNILQQFKENCNVLPSIIRMQERHINELDTWKREIESGKTAFSINICNYNEQRKAVEEIDKKFPNFGFLKSFDIGADVADKIVSRTLDFGKTITPKVEYNRLPRRIEEI